MPFRHYLKGIVHMYLLRKHQLNTIIIPLSFSEFPEYEMTYKYHYKLQWLSVSSTRKSAANIYLSGHWHNVNIHLYVNLLSPVIYFQYFDSNILIVNLYISFKKLWSSIINWNEGLYSLTHIVIGVRIFQGDDK